MFPQNRIAVGPHHPLPQSGSLVSSLMTSKSLKWNKRGLIHVYKKKTTQETTQTTKWKLKTTSDREKHGLGLAKVQLLAKVENFLNVSLDLISSPSLSAKVQIMGWKVSLRCKGKTLLGVVNNLLNTKVCWHHPAMFCFIPSSKLSRQ